MTNLKQRIQLDKGSDNFFLCIRCEVLGLRSECLSPTTGVSVYLSIISTDLTSFGRFVGVNDTTSESYPSSSLSYTRVIDLTGGNEVQVKIGGRT